MPVPKYPDVEIATFGSREVADADFDIFAPSILKIGHDY